MKIKPRLDEIERRVSRAGIAMLDVFRLAGIDRSTWHRWRAGNRYPTLRTWEKVNAAADKLAPPAPAKPRSRRR